MMLLSLLPLTHWYELQDIMVLRSISDNLDIFYPFTECMQCAWIFVASFEATTSVLP